MSSTKIIIALTVLSLSCRWIAAQRSEEFAAAWVFGPQWKQSARVAGMAFSGTVLNVTSHRAKEGSVPTVELKLKVDRAIAGVQSGEVVTICEWEGAWARQRALRPGDHVLLLLYPPSPLGLTSPVNGSQGQVQLDSSGQRSRLHDINVRVLERALRSARGE